MSKIKIFALGGLNETGKNMYVIDVDNEVYIFDAGLKYDNDINLGIDYIIPGFKYISENRNRIQGLFLTHGHESNMGAVKDILEQDPTIPVYGTHLTLELVKDNMILALINKCTFNEIKPHTKITVGSHSIFPISVTHSIPGAVCYVLYTKDGAVVYTGDYTFDSTMLGDYKTDIGKLAYVGKQGVLCLLSESIYAARVGHTSPLDRASDKIREVISRNENRIIISVSSAHFYRIQEIFDQIMRTNRKVVIMGKSLQYLINRYMDEGYLKFDKSKIGDLSNVDTKDIIILISDDKDRPFANTFKIVRGYDKYIKIKETDTIFITEPSYAGVEKRSAELLDEIAQTGANGIMLTKKDCLLHHASSEDLMLMINLMNPKYYFPVRGEYRDLYANAEVAEACGMNKDNIILKLNGEVAEFVDGKLTESRETIPVEQTLISGSQGEDVGDLVLKDREMLGENGIVIVNCTVDKNTKEILGGPEILTRGFIYVKESQDLLEETKDIAREVIENDVKDNKLDYTQVKNDIRTRLGNFFYNETESKPMIITVVQEV